MEVELSPLREQDLEEYVVFRLRLQEFLHIWQAWLVYRTKDRDDPEREISLTLFIVLHVWLYSFFDSRGIDVRTLWPRVFPWLKSSTKAWAAKHRPSLATLEEFRHVTGAHSSRTLAEHNRVRNQFSKAMSRELMEAFVEKAGEVVQQERRRPEVAREVAAYGLKPGS